MRSEHKTTGDEWDLKFRQWYCYLSRAGVAKAIKRHSHRLDRQVVKRQIDDGLREWADEEDAE